MFDNLLRFQKDLKVIIADFETEGLHGARSRPWELAFVVYHGNKLVAEHDLFPYWTDLDVSPGAKVVTRFDFQEYSRRASDPKKCREIFLSYRNDPSYYIIYHNGVRYDSMIDAVWAREIGEKPDYSWMERLIDTNCIAKAQKLGIKPDISSRKNFLAWQFRMSSIVKNGLKTSLTTCGKEFKIEYDYTTLHRGANDTKLNKLVFDKQLWTVEF